jgi:DNA-binding PadR family transcriptional regulator
VPRGFLRLYILSQLVSGKVTGYGIMSAIEEKTEGAWRPGPGTIYPVLKGFVREDLARVSKTGRKPATISYSITAKGMTELQEMKQSLASVGRKERVLMRLLSDLLPPETLTRIVLSRARENSELLREKILEIPVPGRIEMLKELKLLSDTQSSWAEQELSRMAIAQRAMRRSRARRVQV